MRETINAISFMAAERVYDLLINCSDQTYWVDFVFKSKLCTLQMLKHRTLQNSSMLKKK